MNTNTISELISLAIKTDKLSTKTERGQVWQLGLVFSVEEKNKVIEMLSKFRENKRKYSLLSVKTDFSFWLPHKDYEWVPAKIMSEENIDRVNFSKTFSYTIKYFNLNDPDKERISHLEKLALKAKQGIPTGIAPFIIYQRLEQAKQQPLRERIKKIVTAQFQGNEKNKVMQNLNMAETCFFTNFLSASERLVASWYVNNTSKVSRLSQGLSIFFSNEIYKRSDAKIHHLIEQATQSNSCAGNFFFPPNLDLPKKSVTMKKQNRNS
jgi:hypothetical protein